MTGLVAASSIAVTIALFLGGTHALYTRQRRRQRRTGGFVSDRSTQKQGAVILCIILASVAISLAARTLM